MNAVEVFVHIIVSTQTGVLNVSVTRVTNLRGQSVLVWCKRFYKSILLYQPAVFLSLRKTFLFMQARIGR